jgi:hypothetical protein
MLICFESNLELGSELEQVKHMAILMRDINARIFLSAHVVYFTNPFEQSIKIAV